MAQLYQQGNQKIEIIVRKESDADIVGTKEVEAEESTGKKTTWRTAVFGSESQDRINRVIKTNATHILAVGKQIAQLGFQYYVSGLGDKYGDQALQENVSRQLEIFSDVTNVGSATIMGGVFGAWGGPIGAVIGATLGALSSGASTIFKYATRNREYNYKVFKENNSIQYQRARASINLTTGRLR